MCAVSHLVTQTVARRRRRRRGRCRVCLYPGGPAARQPASLALLATVPGLAVSCWSSAVTCGASMAASPPTQHRDNTAVWLLQVCSQEQASPHIFCLAVNMMDRVLSRVEVSPPAAPTVSQRLPPRQLEDPPTQTHPSLQHCQTLSGRLPAGGTTGETSLYSNSLI